MLYVFYNEFDENKYADFVLKDLHNQKVRVVPCGLSLWIYKNRLTRILFNIGFYLRIPFFCNFTDDFKDICRNIKKSDSILIFGGGIGLSPRIFYPLFKICKAGRRYVWLWDSVRNKKEEKNLIYAKKYCDCFTFDSLNARKYGIKYKNTVCPVPKVDDSKNSAQECDVYFVGLDRGRYEILNKYYENFLKIGLSCKFIVLRDRMSSAKEKTLRFSSKRISQGENYDNILAAKAVLDLPVSEQSGLTQRPLEAIFLGRKVITDNQNIKNEKIYDERNIFVLSDENLGGLSDFVSSPFHDVDATSYQIDEWIKEFITEDSGL